MAHRCICVWWGLWEGGCLHIVSRAPFTRNIRFFSHKFWIISASSLWLKIDIITETVYSHNTRNIESFAHVKIWIPKYSSISMTEYKDVEYKVILSVIPTVRISVLAGTFYISSLQYDLNIQFFCCNGCMTWIRQMQWPFVLLYGFLLTVLTITLMTCVSTFGCISIKVGWNMPELVSERVNTRVPHLHTRTVYMHTFPEYQYDKKVMFVKHFFRPGSLFVSLDRLGCSLTAFRREKKWLHVWDPALLKPTTKCTMGIFSEFLEYGKYHKKLVKKETSKSTRLNKVTISQARKSRAGIF